MTRGKKGYFKSFEKTTPGSLSQPDHSDKARTSHSQHPTAAKRDFLVWSYFLQNGGYFSVNTHAGKQQKVSITSREKQQQALGFVSAILHRQGENFWRRGWKSSEVHYHNLVEQLGDECDFDAPRDRWESCLPPKSTDWYKFAALILMLCSALSPDERLVPVMHSLFSNYEPPLSSSFKSTQKILFFGKEFFETWAVKRIIFRRLQLLFTSEGFLAITQKLFSTTKESAPKWHLLRSIPVIMIEHSNSAAVAKYLEQ
jgi:hypothetical protein